MRFSTEIGARTVTLQCRDDLEAQANGVLRHLRQTFSAQSERLKDGFKIQYGWSVLCIRDEVPDLILCEPNFRSNPFMEWNGDISTTLAVLLHQAAFLHLIEFPASNAVTARFDDKIVLSRGCLSDRRICLQRTEVSRGRPGMIDDSGWYIGPVPPRKDPDYQAIRVYELLHMRPAALKVLELPPGFLVILNGDEVEGIQGPGGKSQAPWQLDS